MHVRGGRARDPALRAGSDASSDACMSDGSYSGQTAPMQGSSACSKQHGAHGEQQGAVKASSSCYDGLQERKHSNRKAFNRGQKAASRPLGGFIHCCISRSDTLVMASAPLNRSAYLRLIRA